ncbi:hypothetical protein [Thiorhodococcus minor]|uniref:Uncharacterized protein n=1 Tax=Thiorhodococcus minor TaxID=57489 RepID=A0A6M0JSH7_9GAMM|nr:hypothetical protein [Thiorhodococcus minor]NEV60478.1 hypothetical protein [Thiorhodococcus minor]
MQINRDISKVDAVQASDAPRRLTFGGLMTGFLPAFRHLETGEVRLCRMKDGQIAREHLLDGLPSHWVIDRDPKGRASELVYAVEPGFMRGSEFWTLADFSHPLLDG